jgi:diguanylate cyclase (GGDEF)-like protein/PAS domain S-box-containing protein
LHLLALLLPVSILFISILLPPSRFPLGSHTDSGRVIMYRTYAHTTLAEADDTLNQLLDLIVEGTWDWHGDTGRVERNPGWYRMLGYEVGTLPQDVFSWENIIHPDDSPRVMESIEGFIEGTRDKFCIEYRCRMANGDYLWIRDRARIIDKHPDGRAARILGVHQDIHQQKSAENDLREQNRRLRDGSLSLEYTLQLKAQELEVKNRELEEKIREVEYISNTDQLTAIANRKKFEEDIQKEIRRARRYEHALSLAIFDLDYFKKINDTHGHYTGDLVLQHITALVRNNLRDVDFFARWGGEEFTIIFPDMDLENAIQASDKIRSLIHQYRTDQGLCITSSFGVSQFEGEDTFEDLLRRADDALYLAKENGRNRVESLVKANTAQT